MSNHRTIVWWGLAGALAVLSAAALPAIRGPRIAHAEDVKAVARDAGGVEAQGAGPLNLAVPPNLCGVISLYAFARLTGLPVSLSSLSKPEYVGKEGSSLEQLARAARDHGFYGQPISGASIAFLRELDSPAVLHVQKTPGFGAFNHYVLCLGTRGQFAEIVNAPDPVRRVPLSQLQQYWDGYALVVSHSPQDSNLLSDYATRTRLRLMSAIGAFALVTYSFRRFVYPRLRSSRVGARDWLGIAFQGTVILAISLVLSLTINFFYPGGLLVDAEALSIGMTPFEQTPFPRIEKARVGELMRRFDALVVDARYPEAFEAGHLPGAINIPPVGGGYIQTVEGLSDIPKTHPIVVYCQSAHCPYSAIVAKDLAAAGFSDISIYEPGWVDWTRQSTLAK